jgi:hypothetical protein
MPSLMATSLRWRTHSARTNKRDKEDYTVEDGRKRSTHWTGVSHVRKMGICGQLLPVAEPE